MNNGLAQIRFIPLCIFLLSVIFSGHVFAASSNVAISLSSTSAKYDNDDNIDYKLVVTNSARRGVESIEVKSDLLAVLADIDSGGKGKAFSAVSISANASSAKSSVGDFSTSGNLYAQNVTLAAGDTITYHLTARVADDVVGRIDVSGSFITAAPHETIESNVVSVKRVQYDFSVSKAVTEGDFAPGEVITYQVHIDNNGASLIKGMTVADAVMAIEATSIDGLSVPAFSSTSITASKSGSLSNVGSFNSSGNLSATNVSIDTGGWVEYQIKATVALDIVSSIDNTAEATAHSVTNPSNAIVINPAKPNLSITKTVDKKNDYQVGDELTYTITASNSGRGIAYQYQVKDAVSDISSLLANDASAKHDHTDVGANPFQSWTVKVASIGANSQSALKLAGEVSDVDLDDMVSIAPNESIKYTIKAVTKSVSISPIDNTAQVNDSTSAQVAISDVATSTNLDVLDTALASKKTTATQYSPGQWVPYDITVENSDSTKFANNVTMVDNLTTCVQTEQADGSTSDAFSGWKVKSVEEIGEGTDAGLVANKTSQQSGDFEFVADLAPNGKVVYHIEALVNENSVGHIHDAPGCDAIDEGGSGLEMPKGKIQVKKTVDKTQFIPGDNLTYTITIENPAQGYVINVPVDDAISDVMASSVDGVNIKAFDSWTVTASATNNSGAATNPTKPDLDSSIRDNANINTHATIYPGDIVTYTVTAKTNVKVNGEIRNKVTAGDRGNSEVGSTPYIHDISISKNVDLGTYSDSENTFTYTIEVKNGDYAGFAKGVHVVDDIEGIRADLLEFGPAENPFESWEITAVAEGDEADSGMSGLVKDKNLDVKADIPARGKITYTVVAHLKDRTQDHIIWGTFSNSANAKLEADDVTDDAVTHPKMPNLRVTKVVNQPYYVVGEEVTYTIVIENIGDGYANDTTVFDDIASLGLFDEWKIDYKKTGLGTRVDQEFKSVKTTDNIDTQVDIAPHSKITFEVTGTVINSLLDRGKITNTVKVYDNQNNREFDESADIDEPEKDISVSIDKYSEQVYYHPGQEHVYVVSVTNHSDKEMNDVSVVDGLSTMGVKTANDKDAHYPDSNEDTAFESWGVERTIGSTSEQIIPPGSTTDLNDHIALQPGAEAVYRITTIVKDNVIEDTLENIAYLNVVSIDRNGKKQTYKAFAKVQNHRAESGGAVIRKVSPAMYKPGDKVTYTITASSALGYFNNVAIQDEISKLRVTLLNGGEGNPFATDDDPTHPQFTVDVAIEDANPKDGGSTDGALDGVVKDNTDLDTIIDVAPNDKVVYTITGTVRDDAIGEINNDGLIVKPYAAQIEYKKETVEANYAPGKTLEYLLTVENTGKAHAQDVNIEDAISSVEVTDVNSNLIKAFTEWTIKPVYSGDFKPFASPGSYSDNHDLKTTADIPLGGKFVYHVTATVAETAAGDILNVLNVNDNTTSVTTRPETRQYDVSKEIVAYYDTDGAKLPNNNGYMPGGSVEYRIHIQNNSSSNIADIPVKDAIESIETDYFDNTTGQAFTHWQITTETDSGSVSNAGSTSDDHDIDTLADLGHDGFVDYIIKAQISDKAVGDFSNTVDVYGLEKISPVSTMLPANVTLKKAVFDSAGKTISQYLPSQDVVYKIRLENTKQGTIYNQHLSDILSSITTDIAELSGSGKENPTANPFMLWSVSIDQSSGITNVDGFTGGNNVDIDTDIDIAPLGYIEFTVKAAIRDTALGQITNTAHLKASKGLSRDNRSLSATAVLDPQPKQVEHHKTIVSVGGVTYSKDTHYLPGDEVEYQITVDNQSDGWANNITMKDEISKIMVELAGDKTETAFSSWVVTHVISRGSDLEKDTYLPNYSPTDNLDIEADIAPKEGITFTIKAQIKDNALGTIDANTAIIDSQNNTTNPILPTLPDLDSDKLVLDTSADQGDAYYAPKGLVHYSVWVTNNGKGFANDVHIEDQIDQIKTTDGQVAFSRYSVELTSTLDKSVITGGTYSGEHPLNATIDLAPNETAEFMVTGLVSGNATGTITNTLLVNGVDTAHVDLLPGDAKIIAAKTTDTPNYIPGGKVNFQIAIANASDSIAIIQLKDELSKIEVEAADGTVKPALKNWTITTRVDGDTADTDLSAIGTTGDIDAEIRIASAIPGSTSITRAFINIEATVIDDAIGEFTNTAYLDGTAYKLLQGMIKPLPGKITLTKVTSRGSEPNPPAYVPGETIGFDISIKNSGEGYAVDTKVQDMLDTLKSEIAGGGEDHVFVQWDAVDITTTSSLTSAVAGQFSNNTSGYTDAFNIHPNEVVNIHLEGKVNDQILGDITNVAQASYEGALERDDATYVYSAPAHLLSKQVDKATYNVGDEVTYHVLVANQGGAWLNDYEIDDDLASIQADIAGGGLGTAFVVDSLTVIHDGDPSFVTFDDSNNVLHAALDVPPNTTVDFTLKATLNDNVLGDVQNTVTDSMGETASVVIKPEVPTVTINKTADIAEFVPGQMVTYNVVVHNETASWANDVSIVDAVKDIETEVAGGTGVAPKLGAAFDPATITATFVATGSYVVPSAGQTSALADIAPNSDVTFTIKATVAEDVIGDITNIATANDLPADVTITPQASSLEIHKAVDTDTFIPGQTVNYTVTVTNTGDTWLNDVVIKDPISAITAEIAGSSSTSNIGPAFSSSSLSVKQSESYVSANPDGSISAIADIKPGDTITFTIAAIVSDNVIGEISNTATADDIPSETVIIQPAPFDIEVTKTADTKEFVPGQLITYTVTVYNPTNSWANDVAISDEVSKIEAEIAHDSTAGSVITGPAFDAATITVDITKGTSFVDGTGENATADIAPNSNVVFTIKANVASNVVGEISNIANANDKSAEVVITPKTAIFTIIKSVDEPTFIPSQVMTYSLVVENTTDAWANDVKITDDIAAINVEVAGGKTGPAFDISSLKVISGVVDGEGFVFANPDGSVSAMADIGPASKATVTFEATVAADVVGDIPNTAFANDIASEEVVITPKESTLEITKKVDAAEYVPGQELTYTVTVSNISGSWANDIAIRDEVSKIQAEIAGGSASVPAIGNAFDVSSIIFEDPVVINSIVAKTTDETVKADIAPNESIIFVIKAKVADNVIGDITNNASASGQDASVVTPAAKSEVEITKTSESKTYTDGGKVVYHIDVHNKSQSFANNIALTDEISNIVVDTNLGMSEPAFTDWKVEYEVGDSKTVVMANTRKIYHPANNSDIDAVMDIAPEDTVTFTVTAKVQDHAISTITNTAVITDADGASQEDDAVVEPAPTSTRVSKVSVEEKYTPNQPLSFVLTIANTSSNYIDDMIVVDDMSTVQVKYIDGTTGPAFIPGTISFTPKVVPAGSLTVKGSETSYKVDIAPKSTVTFDVTGTVNEHATSDIQNIAQLNGNDVKSNWVPTVAAKVKGTLTAVEEEYVPGNTIEYHLTLANDSDGIAKNVYLLTQFNKASGTYIDGHEDNAFDSWTIKAVTEGVDTTSGTFTDDSDIATSINIAPHGKVEYTIVAIVNQDMLTPIDLRTFFLDSTINIPGTGAARQLAKQIEVGTSGKLEVLQIPPVGSQLSVVKTVEKASYTDDDKTVQYQLSVNNTGGGNAPNVTLFDDIAGLQNTKGIDVFTDWVITGREFEEGRLIDHFTIKGDQNNKNNLDVIKNMKSNGRNNIEMMIVATINKHLDDDITNVFKATEENGKVTQDEATTHIKKIPDNTGELELTKRATKTDAQVGDVVEYEIIVDNNNESYFNNVVVDDRFPAGFQYVSDSTEMVLSGADGEFETSDDVVVSAEPTLSGSLQFPQVDFDPYEKLRIRYLMRVSIGVTFGKYVNTAVAKVNNSNVSNTGSATVEIEADKLFDTASIIGKVFEDLNGDGFQADATADDIELTTTVKPQDYIAGSTTLEVNGHTVVVDDENTVPAINGIHIDELYGQSKNRTLKQSNKAYIQFKTRTMTPFLLVIETDNGTTITFDAQGKIQRHLEGDVKEELSAEELNVTRNLYKAPDGYLWEIVIENLGVYEDGIPGARLITTEGIKIETDEYGRYHVPDQWVTDKKGRNFLVKLDSDSLPTGMKVISENPKAKRITPHALAKFNFSVQAKTSAGNSQKKKPISS
ncbi:DUF11 domain-containing protein [Photobacterium profundum]|uniref:Cadherin domain-containing protein n=1 Tax=Photobacterium profundum 3TCK TaxID=314280 RepID=Q1Z153_9GAMM|nr:DUF11 domain-containing protein [Photobacterium profundum]EAS42211.1 hypothetical protein P3TCK_16544 [Photobacterium profundum 3TCK]PSV64371.1 DUF11 domain-containing protein [Photobacterium profundum]